MNRERIDRATIIPNFGLTSPLPDGSLTKNFPDTLIPNFGLTSPLPDGSLTKNFPGALPHS